MGQTDVYGLPWPDFPGLANGPKGFEDLAVATENVIVGTRYEPPFAPSYREVSGANNITVPNALWVAIPVPTVGAALGSDMSNDSLSLMVNPSGAPGVYNVEGQIIWFNTATAGRRLIGISTSQTIGPVPGNQGGNSGSSITTINTNVVVSASSRLVLWCYQQLGSAQQLGQRRVFAHRIA